MTAPAVSGRYCSMVVTCMSLTGGLHNPRTPLRRFLDRELSAGPKPLRASFQARHRTDRLLLPPPGVGTEAGTVGTAIDQRLRLAFTTAAPVDEASLIGIDLTAGIDTTRLPDGSPPRGAGLRMRSVGNELAARLTTTIRTLDLDNRGTPIRRTRAEEEDLARMLLATAWYQVLARTPIGFAYTPLARAAAQDPGAFTLGRLLGLPRPDMVADVIAQTHQAAHGPLEALRARTRPGDCVGGPTFPDLDITADADIVVDGLLLDIKSTQHPHHLSMNAAWQLLGYLLLDTVDRYQIDTLGLYLTRSGVLVSWPVEEYLTLLGTRRRELPELRTVLAELLTGCPADTVPSTREEETHTRQLLERLTPTIGPQNCRVCAQPLPDTTAPGPPRAFCSRWCGIRAPTLRKKGWLLTRPTFTIPPPQEEPPEPGTRCRP